MQACLDLLAGFLRVLPADESSRCIVLHHHHQQRHSVSQPEALGESFPSPVATAAAQEDGDACPSIFAPIPSAAAGGGGVGRVGRGIGKGLDLARALVRVAKLLHDGLDVLAGGERQRQV